MSVHVKKDLTGLLGRQPLAFNNETKGKAEGGQAEQWLPLSRAPPRGLEVRSKNNKGLADKPINQNIIIMKNKQTTQGL